MHALWVALLVDLASILALGRRTAVVQTSTGPVQGLVHRTAIHAVEYAAFTGIRFGKPPTGYLRFKPPVPVDPWTEVLNATQPGAECPQVDLATGTATGDEDCLFLSIYTTATDLTEPPRELKSVMVWIYGGAFLTGSESDKRHHPDYILERDVVFVAINYRLGALGFLSLNHVNATGNAGLKDQVLGLKWIQKNIEQFGGNPNNVTIFGESAGAVSVGFHVISDVSAGLFHGVISMSGTPLNPWGFTTPRNAVRRATALGASLGAQTSDPEDLLAIFYAASTADLAVNAPKVRMITPFTPTLEDPNIATDPFITECTINKYHTGNFTKVPQILGFLEQEALLFVGYLDTFNYIIDIGLNIFPSPILNLAKAVIVANKDLVNSLQYDTVEVLVNETTDLAFKAQIDTTQQLLAANNDGKPIWYYHITFTSNTSLHAIDDNITIPGPAHADDIAYIFYVPYANYSRDLSDPTALTIYRVTTMWTNFAKYGDPTPHWVDEHPLGIQWTPSGCQGSALNIGTELTMGPRPIQLSTRLIQSVNDLMLFYENACASYTRPARCYKNARSSEV